MVKVQRTGAAPSEAILRRRRDIGGLLIFFLGAASLLCLSWQQPGILPTQVDSGLRWLAGAGAYVIPLLFMMIGTMFLIGYERLSLSHSASGTLLLFLVFVTARHLALVPDPAPWNSDEIRQAGGVIGWLLGAPLHILVGNPIGYLFLIMLSAVAVALDPAGVQAIGGEA